MSWFRCLPILLLSNLAWAGGFVVGGGVESDSDDALSTALLIDLEVGESTWLSGAVARNSVDLGDDIDLDTNYGDIGFDHYFDPVGIRLGAAYWGDSDLLDSVDGRASLYWRNDRVTVSANLEYRDFEFNIPPTDLLDARTIRFHANGVGLSGNLKLTDAVSLNVAGIRYDYNVPLALSDNRGIRPLLSVSRLSLINSLIDYRVGGGIGVDVGQRRWDLDYRTWKGAVDGNQTNSTTLSFLTPLGKRSDIEFSVGVDDSENFGSVTFFSVFLYFYGGS